MACSNCRHSDGGARSHTITCDRHKIAINTPPSDSLSYVVYRAITIGTNGHQLLAVSLGHTDSRRDHFYLGKHRGSHRHVDGITGDPIPYSSDGGGTNSYTGSPSFISYRRDAGIPTQPRNATRYIGSGFVTVFPGCL